MWYDKDMNENETFEFEERSYANPITSRDEQLSFIDTLRETKSKNTAQINADTYALGSQLPSNLGGLRGGEDTFIARYQTPQTNETAANLRLAAQQSALNTALSNLQNSYKKRYNDAIQNYQKRSATAANTSSSSADQYKGQVDVENPVEYPTESYIRGGTPGTATVQMPDGRYGIYELDANGNVGKLIQTVDRPIPGSAIQAFIDSIPYSTLRNNGE